MKVSLYYHSYTCCTYVVCVVSAAPAVPLCVGSVAELALNLPDLDFSQLEVTIWAPSGARVPGRMKRLPSGQPG